MEVKVSYQLVNLRIERIIVHQIFKRDIVGNVQAPKCSSQFTTLDTNGIATFRDRIVSALGNDAHAIEMNVVQEGPGSTFEFCSRMISSTDDEFITLSKQVTDKLCQAQTSQNIPGGVLVIFDGLVGYEGHKYLGIIKAEIHGGFSVQETHQQLLLRFLNDLALTPSQRLYKIAMLIQTSPPINTAPPTAADFIVLVYDHNMTKLETKQAAKYFYETFLGCTFSPTDKKLTSDFYYRTKEHIDTLSVPDEEKLDLGSALYNYLKVDQTNVVEVNGFAQQYLPTELRDPYRAFMVDKGIPDHAFSKDLTYLKNKLRRTNIKFTSQVRISAPSDHFTDLVKITGHENGRTIVSIEGSVERAD
jgi:hypothetical protein